MIRAFKLNSSLHSTCYTNCAVIEPSLMNRFFFHRLHRSIRRDIHASSTNHLASISKSIDGDIFINKSSTKHNINTSHSLIDIFDPLDTFPRRHIGPTDSNIQDMCKLIGVKDIPDLVSKTIPKNILLQKPTRLGPALSERETLRRLKEIASKNRIMKTVFYT